MLFDHCAQCRRCCHIDPGYPALEVTLTQAEKKIHGSICIQTECTHLGAAGCSLGETKPLSCKLYPLSFNPTSKLFSFDADCPLMPEYQQQLQDKTSEASLHLALMSEQVLQLAKTDPKFLQKNHGVDADYFDLQPLRPSNLPEAKPP